MYYYWYRRIGITPTSVTTLTADDTIIVKPTVINEKYEYLCIANFKRYETATPAASTARTRSNNNNDDKEKKNKNYPTRSSGAGGRENYRKIVRDSRIKSRKAHAAVIKPTRFPR